MKEILKSVNNISTVLFIILSQRLGALIRVQSTGKKTVLDLVCWKDKTNLRMNGLPFWSFLYVCIKAQSTYY